MNRQTHGILSLVIIVAAVLTATVAIIRLSSVIWAVLYLAGTLLSGLIIIYSFCTKCPCRNICCGHVIPGKLARFFPPRQERRYTFSDMAGVAVPLVFLTVFPLFWLLASPLLFILFAALFLIAAADIRFFVCKGCTNRFCPFFKVG